MRLAHSPNPLIFPETNYPGVRDLTHKFRTAGGFSDFNHTSMLVPQSNLHCLSLAPALCQLYIDHYPALALYCDPSLSVSIRQPSLSFSLLSAVGEKKKKQPEGAEAAENRAREWWFPHETAIDFVTCWCHLLFLSGERSERIISSLDRAAKVYVKPCWWCWGGAQVVH